MEQNKRPVHCLDQKRKKFIVKEEDIWNKNDVEKSIRYAIDHFCTLHLKQQNIWKQENSDWKDNDEKFDLCLKTNVEILKPYDEKIKDKIDEKVLNKLTNLTIDKNIIINERKRTKNINFCGPL